MMNKMQGWGGGLALTIIWLFAIYGTAREVHTGEFKYIKNSLYIAECGACHLAYPPQLLPESSWVQTMAGLEDHFGENAEIDSETNTKITAYLRQYGLGNNQPNTMSKMMRELPIETTLRITDMPSFIDTHKLVLDQLEMASFPEGYLSPCADCHRQAASALFDKELLHPGYGPSAWGTTPVDET